MSDANNISRKPNYVFIQYLRVISMILILWDHLIAGGYNNIGAILPISIVDRYIIWPLAITNYFGAFAVDVFFIITGFLTVQTLKAGNPFNFLLKRLIRLMPPLFFGIFSYYVITSLLKMIPGANVEFSSYFAANGALWYLWVLIQFYLVFACCIPMFNKTIVGGAFLLLFLIALLCETGREASIIYVQSLRPIASRGSYIFYIIIGMAISILLRNEKLSFAWFIMIFCISWVGIVYYNIAVFNPERAETGRSFGVSAMYAILLFLVFAFADDRLPNKAWIKKISDYSYNMYLNHMPISAVLAILLSGANRTINSDRLYDCDGNGRDFRCC